MPTLTYKHQLLRKEIKYIRGRHRIQTPFQCRETALYV